MILTDFSNIKIGNTDISSVYIGGEKLWPKGADMSRRIMRFTTTDGNTWNIAQITAYTADNEHLQPEKTSTGWTYSKDVYGIYSTRGSTNLLTYDGFDSPKVRYQSQTIGYFSGNTMCNRIETAKMNVSQCFDMTRMFHSCMSMKSFDVGNWDVSNCMNMLQMFYNCTGATSIDVANWDVSNVEKMSDMFRNCYSLKNLDVSKWNTKSLRYMGMTFRSCRALETLDVSNWNVSHVESMAYTFSDTTLKNLDVSRWMTGKATDMRNMFFNCPNLQSIDVSNWDVSKVKNMDNMFSWCQSLKSIDVSKWNLASCTTIDGIFGGCQSLTTLDLSGWNTSNITNMNQIVHNCTGLTSLNLANWDVSKATVMTEMFTGCSGLTTLDLSNWVASDTTDMYHMFSGCTSLKTISVCGCNNIALTKIKAALKEVNLEDIDLLCDPTVPETTYIEIEKTQGAIDSGVTVGMTLYATGYTENNEVEAITYKQDGSGSGITYDDSLGYYIFPKIYKSIDVGFSNMGGAVETKNLIRRIKKFGNVEQIKTMHSYTFTTQDGYSYNERLESINFQGIPVEKIYGIPNPTLWKTPNLRDEIKLYATNENLDNIYAAALMSNAIRKNDGYISVYYDTTSDTGFTKQANTVLWTTTDGYAPTMYSEDASGNTVVNSDCYRDRGVSDLDVWKYVNRQIEGNIKTIDGFSNADNVYKVVAGLQLGTEGNPMSTLEHINFSCCQFGSEEKNYLNANSFKYITSQSFTMDVHNCLYLDHLRTALTDAGWNITEDNGIITAKKNV